MRIARFQSRTLGLMCGVLLLLSSNTVLGGALLLALTPPPPPAPAPSNGQTGVDGTTQQNQNVADQLESIGGGGAGAGVAMSLPAPFGTGPQSGSRVLPVGTFAAPSQLASSQTNPIGPSADSTVRAQSSTLSSWDGAWVIGYGRDGDVDGTTGVADFDYSLTGIQLGLHKWTCDGLLVGVFGGYGNQDADILGTNQSSEVDSYNVGGFLHRCDECGFYSLVASIGFDDVETERSTATGAAIGDTDGVQASVLVRRGWYMPVGCYLLRPSATLSYVHLSQDGFVETGAGANNLTVGDVDADSLRSILGARLSWAKPTCHGVIAPSLRAHWMHEFLDTNSTASSNFAGAPAFASTGVDLGRDWAILGAGAKWQRTDCQTLSINYDVQVNDRVTFHTVYAGLERLW